MDIQQLIATLDSVEPLNLKGVEMLRHLRSTTGQWFPHALRSGTDREALTEATIEIVGYVRECKATIEMLRPLPPTPLDVPIVEYPL